MLHSDSYGARSSLDEDYAIAPEYSATCSPTGFFAIMIKETADNADPYTEPEPVLSWGDDHAPIIFWEGRFQDAATLPGFQGLRRGRKIIGVIPGGGWFIHAHMGAGESGAAGWSEDQPVIAWAVTESGACIPLIRQETTGYPLATAPADEVFPGGFTVDLTPPT